MERETRLLRCSKLSCYSEFNKMVQAVARKGSGMSTLAASKSTHGTSSEYYFYTTLVMMLRQVVSNQNSDQQKLELQKVYEWFSINKPLIGAHTKQGQRKPTLSLTNQPERVARASSDLERPQTAPASLYQFGAQGSEKRPHTTPADARRPTKTFVSSFVSRSMGMDMNLIGQPFELLGSVQAANDNLSQLTSAQLMPDNRPRSRRSVSSRHSKRSSLSVVSFPSPAFQKSGTPAVSFGEVFSLGPSIAAQMTLDNEYARQREMVMKKVIVSRGHMTRALHSSTGVQRQNTPIDAPPVELAPDLPRNSTPEPKHEKTGMENEPVKFEFEVKVTMTSNKADSTTNTPPPTAQRPPSPSKPATHHHSSSPPSDVQGLQVKGVAYRLPPSPPPREEDTVNISDSTFITTAALDDEVKPHSSADSKPQGVRQQPLSGQTEMQNEKCLGESQLDEENSQSDGTSPNGTTCTKIGKDAKSQTEDATSLASPEQSTDAVAPQSNSKSEEQETNNTCTVILAVDSGQLAGTKEGGMIEVGSELSVDQTSSSKATPSVNITNRHGSVPTTPSPHTPQDSRQRTQHNTPGKKQLSPMHIISLSLPAKISSRPHTSSGGHVSRTTAGSFSKQRGLHRPVTVAAALERTTYTHT